LGDLGGALFICEHLSHNLEKDLLPSGSICEREIILTCRAADKTFSNAK
jgi:hypothetical protein